MKCVNESIMKKGLVMIEKRSQHRIWQVLLIPYVEFIIPNKFLFVNRSIDDKENRNIMFEYYISRFYQMCTSPFK